MCDFSVSRADLLKRFNTVPGRIEALFHTAASEFAGMVKATAEGLIFPDRARPLTRMIARAFDAYDTAGARHSLAV